MTLSIGERFVRDGKIEDNWRDIALERINKIVLNPGHCLQCGKAGVCSIQEHMVTPITTGPDAGLVFGGTIYPQVMLVCNNCGNTRLFNYIVLSAEQPKLDLSPPSG